MSSRLVDRHIIFLQPFTPYIPILTHWKEKLLENIVEKVKLLKMSFFYSVFYAIYILKSCNSHISVVTCSFFEFVMVSKWCIREWVKKWRFGMKQTYNRIICHKVLKGDIVGYGRFLLWLQYKSVVTPNPKSAGNHGLNSPSASLRIV